MTFPIHLVEARIQEAIARGEFENLPGLGKPIPDLDEPCDEPWGVRPWMQRENLDLAREMEALPPAFRAMVRRALTTPPAE